MGQGLDITGKKFGRLTAIKRTGTNKWGGAIWLFICDCGKETEKEATRVNKGLTRSCGCLQHEIEIQSGKKTIHFAQESNVTHGLSKHRLCRIWRLMKNRCSNSNDKTFKNYGSRGITVCDEWLNSSESFFNWAFKNGYSKELSLDRKNNNEGYSPENCKWSTPKEQCNNKRNNRIILFNGESKTLTQWCDVYKIRYGLVLSRLKRGWNISDALQHQIIKPPYTLAGNGRFGKL